MATVNTVLTERIESLRGRPRWPVVAMSLAAHGALVAAVLIAPWLAAEAPAYPEIVSVRIVPVQALGVRDPALFVTDSELRLYYTGSDGASAAIGVATRALSAP